MTDRNAPHEVDRPVLAGLALFFGVVLAFLGVAASFDLYLYRHGLETISRRAWHVGHLHPWVKYSLSFVAGLLSLAFLGLSWHFWGDQPYGYKDTDDDGG